MKLASIGAGFLACVVGSAAAAAEPAACTSWGARGPLLYQDDFSGALGQWASEYRQAPGSRVAIDDGKLVIDVGSGATVWFRPRLAGDVLITYKRKVLVGGGKNDRLSDLNHFWMASDPRAPLGFTRGGDFAEYDALRLYYVGIGGNANTTTRFRKYDGAGQRVLLAEANDARHLLQPNREYAIEIAVYRGCTRVSVDGEPYFTYRDPQPLTEGYFGLRTTESRHEVDDFKVHRLE